MKTRNTLLSLVMIFTTLTLISCEKKETEDPPEACEVNRTGEVYFINQSNSNRTYDIIWDGVKITTVAPNQQSDVFTYSANVKHSLIFRYTNTSDNACTPSEPILNQCRKIGFSCSY